MSKYLQIIIVMIGSFINAQIIIEGSVKDENNLAIPYCSLGIKNSETGAISDENGQYKIIIPDNITANEIVFEASGYDEKIISIADLKKNSAIILTEKSVDLNEVVVKTEKMKDKTIGQKNRPMLTFSKMFDENLPTIEQGHILKIYPNTKINAYNFYIIPSSKFEEITLKLNIYSVKNGLPDQSLLDENIIYTTSSTAWQKIDLSDYKLRIKNTDKIAITIQLIGYKKLENEAFVFGVSAKKSTAKDLLFRYQSQGNWENSPGVFISNLDISYNKDKVEDLDENMD